jgi:GNAT superfamily N-acetyltransferase
MRGLARFEGYLESFAVSRTELVKRAFGPMPECRIEVAEDRSTGKLCGYSVVLLTRFTYDLKPTLRLKELYVEAGVRRRGVGEALLRAIARYAVSVNAGRLKWDVLPGNIGAERFYRSLGGRRVDEWIAYVMDDPALRRLAASQQKAIPEKSRARRRNERRRSDRKRGKDRAR